MAPLENGVSDEPPPFFGMDFLFESDPLHGQGLRVDLAVFFFCERGGEGSAGLGIFGVVFTLFIGY